MSLETVFLKREIRELEDEAFELYDLVDDLEEEVSKLRQVVKAAEAEAPERNYWEGTITAQSLDVDSTILDTSLQNLWGLADNVVFTNDSGDDIAVTLTLAPNGDCY